MTFDALLDEFLVLVNAVSMSGVRLGLKLAVDFHF